MKRAVEDRLSCRHPADVSANGINFAVVGHVAIRMSELPAGKCIRGEALMDETERAGDQWICQFEVELLDLRGQHQALVDDGATRERWNVEVVLAFDVRGGHLVFGTTTHEIKRALKCILVHALGTADEELLDVGL